MGMLPVALQGAVLNMASLTTKSLTSSQQLNKSKVLCSLKYIVFYWHWHSSPSSLVAQPVPVVQQGRQQDTTNERRDRNRQSDIQQTRLLPAKPLNFNDSIWSEIHCHQSNCHASRKHLAVWKAVKHSQLPRSPHCWHQAVPKTQHSDI